MDAILGKCKGRPEALKYSERIKTSPDEDVAGHLIRDLKKTDFAITLNFSVRVYPIEIMNLLINHTTEIQALCKEFEVKSLYAFGSVNSDRFSPESDVDFIVDLGDKTDFEYAEAYFQLAERLEQILKRSVDLVTVRSLKNPYFIQKVEESKSLLYAA
jgi:predicted nucleotidyltransferase